MKAQWDVPKELEKLFENNKVPVVHTLNDITDELVFEAMIVGGIVINGNILFDESRRLDFVQCLNSVGLLSSVKEDESQFTISTKIPLQLVIEDEGDIILEAEEEYFLHKKSRTREL